jgi:aminopeptidase N
MRRELRSMVIALAFSGFLTAGATASPFSAVDRAQGLLPKDVVPSLYVIDVAPNPTTMKIAGRERVTVTVRKPTRTIVLNALQIAFGSVTLDGMPATVSQNAGKQEATLSFPRVITVGPHLLRIAYTATLQTAAQGLFKQSYSNMSGKPTYMYGTQLEATDARRLFPGWDEPAFKARFRMSFVVPKDWTAVSNTPIASITPVGTASKRVSFTTTPPMSSYLVVLCAGDFQKISTVSDGIKLSVYVTRGKLPEAQYALSVMKDLMPYYDSYYGVKFPIKKLDTIAIPGGFLGAMENWGGITYNESTILFNPKLQPASDEKEIFSIIAHEESHQWNGDLTSFAWWDDVWLAEGFATWMQTKAPAHFHPEWHMYIGADNDAQRAMESDAQITTHPVYIPVHNETEAAAVFDQISYTKAGALFRMLEQYVGPAKFETALQHYFRTHEYTSFSARDLWNDLSEASGANVAAITHDWIYEPGFPVITATASCSNGKRTISLTQERYLNDAKLAPGSTVWTVPINLQTDATSKRYTPVLMTKASQSIEGGSCSTPFVLNGNDVGFYRTQYDAQSQAQQQASFLKLSTADRLSLLDDSLAFASSGRGKLGEYLAYAKADAGDRDPFVARAILSEYDRMLAFEKGKPGEAAVKTYITGQVKPMLPAFGGWDGTGMSDEELQVRNQILNLLARCDDSETIAEANRRFAVLVKNPDAYAPLTKQAVIGIAGYAADPTTYQQLLGMAIKATDPTEKQNDFFALFGAKDPQLAAQSLAMSLHLPPQFAAFAPYIVYYVGQQHPKLAWSFLKANSDKIFATMSAFERVQAVSDVASGFATLIPAADIRAYLNAHVPPAGAAEVKKAMDDIDTRQAVEDRLLPQIDAYVDSQVERGTSASH